MSEPHECGYPFAYCEKCEPCIHGRMASYCSECRRAEMGEAAWPDDLPFQDADDAIMDAEDA